MPENQEKKRGLICAKCGGTLFDTRNTERKAGFIVRYRVCVHCGRVRKTAER